MKRVFVLCLFSALFNASISFGQFTPDPDKWYRLVYKHSGLSIRPADGQSANGILIEQQNISDSDPTQLWRFQASAAAGYWYPINRNGKALDVYGDWTGVSFGIWDRHGGDNQQFRFDTSPMSGYYFMVDRRTALEGTNLTMDVTGASASPGALVIAWPKKTYGFDNQLVQIVEVSPITQHILADEFSSIAGWERKGVAIDYDLSWEGTLLQDPSILYNQGDGALFKMWYGAGTRIGFAESNDGMTWTKTSYPVLVIGSDGSTDDTWLTVPSVVYKDGTYYMTYCGYDGTAAKIHLATAASPGGPWAKQGVILAADQAYEDNFLYNSSLMFDSDENLWKMWYTAGKIASAGGEPHYIAYATSPSPFGPWTKYAGNPVLQPMGEGGWANLAVGGPNVIKKNGQYFMTMSGWQNDYPSRGGRITSMNGINWTLSRTDMQLDLGISGTWEDCMVYRQYIVNVNGTEYMYYNAKDSALGWNERIGLAVWNNNLPIVDPSKWTQTFGARTYGSGLANGGSFAITSGKLQTLGLAPWGGQQILQGNAKINVADYSISADVTPLSTTDALKDNVLHIRAQDLSNYYYAGIASWGAKYAMGKVVGGTNSKLASTGTASEVVTNTTYNLKLIANGSSLQLYDNGILVLSATDTSLNPTSSYAALETSTSTGQAYFDNVIVDSVNK